MPLIIDGSEVGDADINVRRIHFARSVYIAVCGANARLAEVRDDEINIRGIHFARAVGIAICKRNRPRRCKPVGLGGRGHARNRLEKVSSVIES